MDKNLAELNNIVFGRAGVLIKKIYFFYNYFYKKFAQREKRGFRSLFCLKTLKLAQKRGFLWGIRLIWRAPVRFAACPTQPYKCGQNVKVKVKINDNAVLILILEY